MHPLRVLLADDHDGFRNVLVSFLKTQRGVEVVGEAADGIDAVVQAERLHPDLVLMDIHMPGQNGIEATKVIKHRLPSTRVFILSMDAGEFYSKNNRGCADGFIAKSSMKDALLSVLSSERRMRLEMMTGEKTVV
jgi:two-component system response regulator NreC